MSHVARSEGLHHFLEEPLRGTPQERVGEVVERLRRRGTGHGGSLYVIDSEGRLLGVTSAFDLLLADRDAPLSGCMKQAAASAHPEEHQERVALRAIRHGLDEMPVVDASGRLLGVVPAAALLAILHEEHTEDLHRLAGIRREEGRARSALEEPLGRQARDRLPWLVVGLAGSALATFVMARFEAALEARVALAFFVPGIVYLADAIGTQTEAIVVRGLSLSHLPLRTLFGHELRAGVLIGFVLGALVLPAVWLTFGDFRLALVVASALLAAGTAASTLGLLLPWILARLGTDPAFGSGPVATVIQDVLSLLIYLGLARAFLAVG
jgi:magnesium transporter